MEERQVPADESEAATMLWNIFTGIYVDELTNNRHMSVKVLEHDYGGPATLAKYKAYIEFPYQVSTMKFYENIAHGVVILVPTARFQEALMEGEVRVDSSTIII